MKYNFFCLPAGDITKPHQTGMCKSAKLPWFNILFLLSNSSKAENTLNFKEWRKSKRKSENTLQSYAACCRWPCFCRSWTRWPTEVPSNPYHSV